MSLPPTLTPFSGCDSFSDSEHIARLFQGWLGLWTHWICGGLSLSEIHCLCWEEWKVSNCFTLFWAWIGKSSQSVLLPVLLSSASPKDDSPTTRCWNLPTRMIKEARRQEIRNQPSSASDTNWKNYRYKRYRQYTVWCYLMKWEQVEELGNILKQKTYKQIT